MKTLRALILLLVAPVLMAGVRQAGERDARPDSSRPLVEMRDVVGVVASADVIDVYWLHTDERVEPVRSTLFRTRVSADGSARLATARIHPFDEHVSASVASAGGRVQVLWNGEAGIVVSPIEGDALTYPHGKPVAFGNYAGLTCHTTDCVVVYDVSNTQMAVILDGDGDVVSAPFPLPAGFYPLRVVFDERGIFFVRHVLTGLRAALVHRDGSVAFDVAVADADPRAFHAAQPAVTRNGSEYVVAFVDFGAAPDAVNAVRVAGDGRVSAPERLLQVEEHRDLPNNVGGLSLAANGSRFLLGGDHVIGSAFLVRLDAALHGSGAAAFLDDATPTVLPHPDGSSFVVLWHTALPYLTIVHGDGSMTAPVAIVPPARRRSVR